MKRTLLVAVLVALLVGVLGAATASAQAAAAGDGRRSYTGTIEGAAFRVEVPERWNGTLLLYSHGYQPAGFPSFGIA